MRRTTWQPTKEGGEWASEKKHRLQVPYPIQLHLIPIQLSNLHLVPIVSDLLLERLNVHVVKLGRGLYTYVQAGGGVCVNRLQ